MPVGHFQYEQGGQTHRATLGDDLRWTTDPPELAERLTAHFPPTWHDWGPAVPRGRALLSRAAETFGVPAVFDERPGPPAPADAVY